VPEWGAGSFPAPRRGPASPASRAGWGVAAKQHLSASGALLSEKFSTQDVGGKAQLCCPAGRAVPGSHRPFPGLVTLLLPRSPRSKPALPQAGGGVQPPPHTPSRGELPCGSRLEPAFCLCSGKGRRGWEESTGQ